jgi:hypothetical protein
MEFTSQSFDDSSIEWMKNKKKYKNGIYTYKCLYINKWGKICSKDVYNDKQLCVKHWASS